MKITEYVKNNILYLDGGMGTLLQDAGFRPGEYPERWNLSHPEIITGIHTRYYDAGSNVVLTNTFGANPLKFSPDELEAIIRAAVANAREAARKSAGTQEKWVALDIGPSGRMFKPYGDLDFEDAVNAFAAAVKAGADAGADLIFIETMNDSYETKAALLAAKENSSLPVFVSNTYGADGKLMTGASTAAMVAMLESMGADAVGVNCSLGPRALVPVVEEYLRAASVPVLCKPNAGMPRARDGKTVFDVGPDEFSRDMADMIARGVRIAGGCCGTTPEYIRKTVQKTRDLPFSLPESKRNTVVASYTHTVSLSGVPKLIGERINPTGKPKLQAALQARDLGYLVREGIAQQDAGAHILDVNVGLGGVDEASLLSEAVEELQSVIDLPLQIDTVRPAALERALRVYNGKPLINSVNAKEESLATVLPLARKYGGVLIALTIGEDGIPATAEGRCALAKKIIDRAAACGIDKKDIVVDPLCMAVSADDNAARVTLEAIRLIRETLGVGTCLGVSNVSFALPERQDINAAFLAMALQSGLSCAIMNPCSDEMMRAYRCFCMLQGFDPHCESYISFAQTHPRTAAVFAAAPTQPADDGNALPPLMYAVAKGLQKQAAQTAKTLLQTEEPLSLINEQIVPALNLVGERFRQGSLFLPQLLMSAEAAAAAFDTVSAKLPQADGKKGTILLATVQGDVHDIGKKIVKVLLQSYGYAVLDLGKDVPPQRVLEAAKETGTKLVGLSALMTTTLDAMAETVKLLKKELPGVFVMVGGAVLTQEYADLIGADGYSKDAMGAVALADRFFACNET